MAYLALRAGEAYPREKLAALFWSDAAESQARTSLRQTLSVIGKAFDAAPAPCLATDAKTVAVVANAVDVDVVRFEAAVRKGTTEALEEAVELYRGDLLDGVVVDEPDFEAWLLTERERLREMAIAALARLLTQYQASPGAIDRAIQTGFRLLALDPCQEPVHRTLMRLYAGQGRHAAALRQYQFCVTTLRRELNTEPDPETRRVYREMLQRRAPSGARAGAVAESEPETTLATVEVPARETPLIGRENELRRLARILEDAWRGTARVVIVLGETGVGKTRLVEELCATAARRSGRAVVGRCYETEQILPFAPWVEALRAAGVAADAAAVADLPRGVRATLARLFPELSADVDAGADAGNPLRLFEALVQLAGALASRAPLLIALEDLHWADDMTLRFLAFLGRRLPRARLLVVGTAREEEVAQAPSLRRTLEELEAQPVLASLQLGALSSEDTAQLVRALTKAGTDEAKVAGLADRVWRSSAGNPFVAVETTRAIEDGVEAAAPGGIAVAGSVRDLIVRRLDRLSASARHVAAVAAVAGGPLDVPLLERASGLSLTETAEALEELVRQRVFHGVGEGFDFTHDRVRQVADAGLLAPRRESLHAAIAAALEALNDDALAPMYDRLAYITTRGRTAARRRSSTLRCSPSRPRGRLPTPKPPLPSSRRSCTVNGCQWRRATHGSSS